MTAALLLELGLCVLASLVLLPNVVVFSQVVAALPRSLRSTTPVGPRPSLAVLIPAHDETGSIANTIRSIVPQLQPDDRLIVVADNCTDNTATTATAAGAEVVERSDQQRRGKGFALDFGIRHIALNPREVVVVIDADCYVDEGAIDRIARLSAGAKRPVQCVDLMRSAVGAGRAVKIAEFAWLVKNYVRALGAMRLGLPCQLMGTGMAFPWSVIGAIRFATGEIVEDLECGVELARAGHLPLFCPEARVTSFFPVTAAGVAAQRKRWEHGHLGLILRMALPLLVDGIRRRNLNLVAMSLDMSVPPLALLFLASVTVFLLCALLYGVHNLVLPLWMASAALVLLSLSTLLAWTRYGRHIVGIRELAFAPVYALMKIPLYLAFIVRRQVEWVRSARDGD